MDNIIKKSKYYLYKFQIIKYSKYGEKIKSFVYNILFRKFQWFHLFIDI